ncbi:MULTISPECIES: transglutaminase-like domain-containing protein [unclassified Robiginitalea]|uniref:transglutaminase-like domain-containing protein n=1 Tax=Robiginitalea TaxID=252306 RepID=UPI00234B2A49|nr:MULTISPECIES: transglutaminase family protein [unclassified Robiginitalea]MDC6354191.1 transglutaminase family protein [Robiginitalea sp. PM2]MDC6374458.1 transglutaminase family protein [Robiginitalea sp. SP8]
MAETYTIRYTAENRYDHPVVEASWQFLIVPLENASQSLDRVFFSNSRGANWEFSQNGFGFTTIRVRNRHELTDIAFEAEFEVLKQPDNPFDFDPSAVPDYRPGDFRELSFRLEHQMFLKPSPLTLLPDSKDCFRFDTGVNCMENLTRLNAWVYEDLDYMPGETGVDTPLSDILDNRKGVCQDFAHLFVAIAREHGLPARYVSGYLHQGMGYVGDAQMHAWAEAFVPGIGWKGFDPTNNLLAASDHIKVAHGRDYSDCAPIKGVVFGPGGNSSNHQVAVSSQQ